MTAGEIAGRLTAKKIEPLVRYVERATGTKLRLEAPQRSPKADRASKSDSSEIANDRKVIT